METKPNKKAMILCLEFLILSANILMLSKALSYRVYQQPKKYQVKRIYGKAISIVPERTKRIANDRKINNISNDK